MILQNAIGRCELHQCTASEPGRYAMHNINVRLLDDGKIEAAATDGRKLAVVVLDADIDDADGLVPKEAWQAALKSAGKTNPPRLTANGTCAVRSKDGTALTHFDRPDGEFPRYHAVIPQGFREKDNPNWVSFTLNPEYLLQVAKAIGQNPEAPCITVHLQAEEYREMEPVLDEQGNPVFEKIPVCYEGTQQQAIDLDGNPRWQDGKPLMRESNRTKFRQKKNVPLVVTNGDDHAVGVVMPITVES